MEKPTAIYARVSSDRQKESQTIASQTVALTEYAKEIAGKQGPDGALLLEAERLGFRKLTFTDGERNFPFPLTPKGEEENVQAILKTLGLDAPLNLTVPDPAP